MSDNLQQIKICVNCRYVRYSDSSTPYCDSPQRPPEEHATILQLVDGEPLKLQWMYATHARAREEYCGLEGRWFVRRRTFMEWLSTVPRRIVMQNPPFRNPTEPPK